MIPKIIHYCWFGKQPKSELIIKCLSSWEAHLPDFQLMEWNDDNCQLDNTYARLAYTSKKWAFVADYVRLKVLYDIGGIYLDTDMLVIKPLHPFLEHRFFIGCEKPNVISMGILGCVPQHPFIANCLKHYETQVFHPTQPVIITRFITDLMKRQGFTTCKVVCSIDDMYFYPSPYFYPFPFPPYGTYYKHITENTFAIHLWAGSWLSEWQYFIIGNPKAAIKLIGAQLKKVENQNSTYLFKTFLYLVGAPFWVLKSFLRRKLRRYRKI